MIAAAQGARSGNGGGAGSGSGTGGGTGSGTGDGRRGRPAFIFATPLPSPRPMPTLARNSVPARTQISSAAQLPKHPRLSSAHRMREAVSTGQPGVQQGAPGGGSNNARAHFAAEPTEDEILGILSALTSIGQVGAGGGTGMAAAGAFHEQMSQLPGRAQDTLKAALAEIAAHAPDAKPDQSTLDPTRRTSRDPLRARRYEKGEVKVNAVRQMLDRMNPEIETLRKLLGSHEDKMSEAGIVIETHREILDRQFWAAVPESGKRTVLLSTEAWCIPPRNVQSYVGELIEQGNIADAISVLQNYAACADSEEYDARKKTAAGLSQMAELYAKIDPDLLVRRAAAPRITLNVEQDADSKPQSAPHSSG